jgi:hypothetical protein
MSWPYPTENQDPWFDAFETLLSAIDVSAFASREDRNIVMMGGGTFTFDAAADTLTWTSQWKLLSPVTGLVGTLQVPASPIDLVDGQILYVNVTRNARSNVTLTPQTAYQVPSTDNAFLLGIRSGTRFYFRNGAVLYSGSGSPVQAGGVSVPKQDVFSASGSDADFNLTTLVPSDKYDGVRVFKEGLRMKKTASPSGTDEYTVLEVTGITTVRFGSAPTGGHEIIADYWV